MGGNAKCYSHFGRQFSDFLQNLSTLSMHSISHVLWCLFKEVKTYKKRARILEWVAISSPRDSSGGPYLLKKKVRGGW